VCIGAGTGLGQCYLTPNCTVSGTEPNTSTVSYTCYASEGGHVEYAPRNDIEIQMFQYLSDKFVSKNRISVERVVSGKGLANVYEYLSQAYPTRIVQSIHDAFLVAGDEQGRVVAQSTTHCTLCQQAMSIMISAYGCETGSVAIKFIPTGGLFVTGGLTPKNIHFIEGLHSDFMISYLNKGRVSPILQHIPLFAVMVEDLGVRGAHKAAYTEYETYVKSLNDTGTKKKKHTKQRQVLLDNRFVVGTIGALLVVVGRVAMLRRKR
jgi:glucokinase